MRSAIYVVGVLTSYVLSEPAPLPYAMPYAMPKALPQDGGTCPTGDVVCFDSCILASDSCCAAGGGCPSGKIIESIEKDERLMII